MSTFTVASLTDTLDGLGAAAIATAVVAAIFGSWLHRRDLRHEKAAEARRLASALLGEVHAISKIGRERYSPAIDFALGRLKAGSSFDFYPAYTGNEFFALYKARVSDLGLLPTPMPERIVGLYTRFSAIQEDLRTIVLQDWARRPAEERRLFLARVRADIRAALVESESVESELRHFVG